MEKTVSLPFDTSWSNGRNHASVNASDLFVLWLTSSREKLDFDILPAAGSFAFGRLAQLNILANEIKEKDIAGNVAELGVFRGGFAKYIRQFFPDRLLYLFDTFEGFDPEQLKRNMETYDATQMQLPPVSLEELFDTIGTQENCIVKKGLFPETAKDVEETFCFVSIDVDLYQPILDGLKFFYPRLSGGGYIMVHDYGYKGFHKGVSAAVREFCAAERAAYIPICDHAWSCVIGKPKE